VGQTEADANTAITAVDNLTVGTVSYEYSDAVAAGVVISQSPVAGTTVAVGSSVDLVVSLGQPIVPDVEGQTEADANTAITAVDNLTVGAVSYEYSDAVAAGVVIGQNPVAGTTVAVGASVDIVVSLGQPVVPDVVGQTEADANTAITAVDNLTVGTVSYEYSDLVTPGFVISQNPVAGVTVPIGSAVDLVVSAGQPVVPDVVGMTEADANSAVTSLGLAVGTATYEYSDAVAAGLVINQNPVAGTSVPTGSLVDLAVSLGQPVVPDVVGQTEADANTAITAVDNLTVGVVTHEYSDTVSAGLAISQNPVGGTSVPTGSSVDLAVSLGQPVVPDVVGMTRADANSAIVAVSLTVGSITYEYSDTVVAGFIMSQNPGAGASVPIGSSVDIVISLGGPVIVMAAGGNRLVELQNNDGGWDWPSDDGDPNSGSDSYSFASVAMGLVQAYRQTSDPNMLTALEKSQAYLLSKTDSFVAPDGGLAVELDGVLGGSACTDHVISNFYDKLATGTYYDAISDAVHNTSSYIQTLRDRRFGEGTANLAAWDLGLGLYDTYIIGAGTSEWIAGVKAEIDELNGDLDYDVLGLAGAVFGLAAVGEDYDPQAGEHAGASNLGDLAAILSGYQLNTGGFTWNEWYMEEGTDETVQETVYALMALNEFDRSIYLAEISSASAYLQGIQLATGGWENYPGDGENSEITGGSIWGIVVAVGQPEVPDVVGMTEADAIATIEDIEKLEVGTITYEYSDTIVAGLVISQSPAGGTTVAIGSDVDLVISFGRPIVPDVRGMTEADANSTITAVDNLTVGSVTYEYSETVPQGLVISQNPRRGTAVPVGSSIDLVVSLGEPVIVPDVLGQAESDANSVLTALSLKVGTVTYEYSAIVPAGLVISQSPVAGSAVPGGSTVDLVVSGVLVPDVVEITEADANSAIVVAGLTLGAVTYEYSDTAATGFVISQYPVGGTAVRVGSFVELVVSLGPAVVPDVIGQTEADANLAIAASGLTVGAAAYQYSDTIAAGIIMGQDPIGGTTAPVGSSVDLTVSLGQPVVPDVLGQTEADANLAITSIALVVGTVTHEYSDTITAGRVISQNPAGGMTVLVGSYVDLVVSLGPPIAVPDVVGMLQVNANSAISAAGLAVGVVTVEYSDTVPFGNVISQDPTAGTIVPLGTSINLVTSIGQPAVPHVVGITEADANSAIISVDNLTVGSLTYEYSDVVGAGLIISQSPLGGTEVSIGSSVDLVVSLGQPVAPDVIGQTEADANTAITAVDNLTVGSLTYQYSDIIGVGLVMSQSPPGGTTVPVGFPVNLVVSLGQPVVPDVVGMTETDANSVITAVSLIVGTVTYEYSDTVGAGTVINQTPRRGTTVLVGSAVNLIVSLGQPVVPDVAGMAEADAVSALTTVTLAVGTVTHEYSATVPAGHVVSHDPAAGTIVPVGSAVDLVIALAVVPDVVGMAKVDANSLITAAGLALGNSSYEYSDTIGAGVVISQNPLGGTQLLAGSSVDLVVSLGEPTTVLSSGGNRLVEVQNNDGGWDWPSDEGDPNSGSDSYTFASVALGLAKAYRQTSDSNMLAALQKAQTFLLSKTDNFAVTDGALAVELDSILGGTACLDHVIADFYDKLAAGTYADAGSGLIDCNTAEYVQAQRDRRTGGLANMAAWDLGLGLHSAYVIGADTSEWLASLKAEIDELSEMHTYDVLGLAGAVLGLAVAGEDYDPQAGQHATASSLSDLAQTLAGYQLATGGFTWYSAYMQEDTDETVQETAYALMALSKFDRSGYLTEVSDAGNYLQNTQLMTGGWENYAGLGEENEITGEVLRGIAIAVGHPVVVPDVAAMTEANARLAITAAGFTVGTITYEFSDTVTAGLVISQSPTGGTTADNDSSIELVVSLGEPVFVPDVTGMTQVDASSAFTSASLEVGIVTYDYNDTVPEGLVASQYPAAGTAAPVGSSVDLVISLGPPVIVPDVVGMTQTDADSAITAVGLILGTVTYSYNDTVAASFVISQNPVDGTIVPLDTPVDMVVSLGQPVVPYVVGITEADANSAIAAVQLTVGGVTYEYSDTVAAGLVISQNPLSGTRLPIGSFVDLTVSLGQPIVVPDVTGMTQAEADTAMTAVGLIVDITTYQYSQTVATGLVISQNPVGGTMVPVGSSVDVTLSLGPPPAETVSGGNRLIALQNNDGGWDVQLDDGNPDSGSDPNTFASVAIGLAEAYRQAGDPGMLGALQTARTFLLSKTNNFGTLDGVLAVELDDILGGTACANYVMTNFYDKLAAGTYIDVRTGPNAVNTTEYIQAQRDRYTGTSANLAAWELGLGLYSAYVIGADATEWIAAVKAEIDELNSTYSYDVLGLAGAVLGLAAAGEDYDPQAGEHAATSSLADLAVNLAGYQLGSGGFTWHKGFMDEGYDEVVPETAYAIMALNEFGRAAYIVEISEAGSYLGSMQLVTGGWEYSAGSNEQNEITGNALRGIGLAMGQPTVVPDVVGMVQTDANSAVTAAGLIVGTLTYEYSYTIPAHVVISQDPIGGIGVPVSSTVDLVVSLGEPVVVPNVVGQTQTDANSAITVAGLMIGVATYEYSYTVAADHVISQSPGGGITVPIGSLVDLAISLGPPVIVPNVAGTAEAAAESAITAAGLTVGTLTYEYSNFVPEGLVISQNPVGGTIVPTGSLINLVVSLGQPVVPNVVGMQQTAANSAITLAGLAVGVITDEYSDTVSVGLIINQNPIAGTTVPVGSPVNYLVSLGQPVVPDVVGMTETAAGSAITSVSLMVGAATYVHSNTVTAGLVMAQNPIGGATVSVGSTVSIVVSLGPPVVPDVVGMTQAAAISAIGANSLTVGTTSHEYSDTIATGHIVSQNPIGGTVVSVGSPVDLVVSLGPATTTPNVVGMFKADANSTIVVGRLLTGIVTYKLSDTQPAGHVISQNPVGGLIVPVDSYIDLVVSLGQPADALLLGANRLVELQNDDGGWDRPPDDGDPGTGSDPETFASAAIGLAQAYRRIYDNDILAALQKAETFLLSKTDDFAVMDGALAIELDNALGHSVCADYVNNNFYSPLEAGTYYDDQTGDTHDTTSFIQAIRDRRSSEDTANMAAWDLGMGAYSAYVIGANTTEWVTALKEEIDELDGGRDYDVLGLAGAVFALAAVGEDYDPQSGQHAAASNLDDLAEILASYQIYTGGFTWHWLYKEENIDETLQETAYALLALNEFYKAGYFTEISDASAYMQRVQLATGGWENVPALGENNEITGEVLRAIEAAIPGAYDYDPDGNIGLGDFAMFASSWQTEAGDIQWNPIFDISEPKDNIIDGRDLAVLMDSWLTSSE
jgi:beta-lactam-binding protein with PASTA domain